MSTIAAFNYVSLKSPGFALGAFIVCAYGAVKCSEFIGQLLAWGMSLF